MMNKMNERERDMKVPGGKCIRNPEDIAFYLLHLLKTACAINFLQSD